jgi:spore germination cell wall hydrolase CwlJ-like protein
LAVQHNRFAVAPPFEAIPFERRASTRLSRLFGMIAIPCLFAAGGYFANDIHYRANASFEASLISTMGPTADGGDLGIGSIPREALHLFGSGHKGPRADRYYRQANTLAVEKQGSAVTKVAEEISQDGVQRRGKSAALFQAAGAAVQDEDAARPENAGLMANAAFYIMTPEIKGGMFNAVAAGGAQGNANGGWAQLIKNASLSPDHPETIFGGLTEEEFRERELRCMATAIYFEARGEPILGQEAVGQVIMNRIRSPIYPKTICGVVYQGSLHRHACQFSFACDGEPDRATDKDDWATSLKVAKDVISRKVWVDEVGYATHYHATYVKPEWRHLYERVAKIGTHIFYRVPPGAVQVALALDEQ